MRGPEERPRATQAQRLAFRCWSGLWRPSRSPYSRQEAVEILRDLLWDVPPQRRSSVFMLTRQECQNLVWRMLVLGLVTGEPDREWRTRLKTGF